MDAEAAHAIYRLGEAATVKFILDLDTRYQKLAETVTKLEKKITALEKNSSTSSKPPSSDDITKKKKKKRAKANKIGAQEGHEKHSRPPFEPDEINDLIPYTLEACPECHSLAITVATDQKPEKVQQIELMEIPIVISEHYAYPVWCDNCQKHHSVKLPDNIVKAGLFGEKMTALVAYLKNVCHCSYTTICKFFADVYHVDVSRGFLAKVIQKVSAALKPPYEELLKLLPLEGVIFADETGHKNNGDLFWTWVFKTDLYILFKIDPSRGSKVLIEVLGEDFNGVLSCDYFSAYRKFMKDFNVTIQFCIAHLIRNIKFMTTLKDAQTKAYANQLLGKIRNMFQIIHNREGMDPEEFKQQLQAARHGIIGAATVDTPTRLNKNGKEQLTEVANMVGRFQKFGAAYFEFITTPGVQPTNNAAEQAIRFIVIDRLITQGTRGINGQIACERVWTVIATCALQGRSAFDFILAAVHADFRGIPSPTLLPDTS